MERGREGAGGGGVAYHRRAGWTRLSACFFRSRFLPVAAHSPRVLAL